MTVDDDGPLLRSVLLLPGCERGHALEAFTSPALLAKWWANAQLTADLIPGGTYDVFFAKIPARMTGRVIRYEPASALEFSWAWAHEPDAPARSVQVLTGTAVDGTTTLTIEHGPHADDAAGLAARAENREGWEHFLPLLHSLLTAEESSDA